MAFQLIPPLGGKRKMALLEPVYTTLCTYCQQVAFEGLFASWVCDIGAVECGGGCFQSCAWVLICDVQFAGQPFPELLPSAAQRRCLPAVYSRVRNTDPDASPHGRAFVGGRH